MRFQDWQHDEAYLELHPLLRNYHRLYHHDEYDDHHHYHLEQVYDERQIWLSGRFG